MIKILDSRGLPRGEILARKQASFKEAEKVAEEIVAEVAARGDRALLRYAEKFDGYRPEKLEVTEEELSSALNEVGAEYLAILEEAKANIEDYHRRQIRQGYVSADREGVVLGQKITPLERVGIYVPGGTASYPSTVLMNAVPARLAGVKEIVMVTPAGKTGKINPAVLAAAKVAGVDRIFKTGGAQAVAALAYGTETVPKADKIVGPGNAYVAAAKRLVYGIVDIDMIAGPSEILVLADSGCMPERAAADLLSQAEHDRLATAVLITDSEKLAEETARELERQLKLLPREEIARSSIENNGKIIVVENLDEGVEIANALAPEHLELCVKDPFGMLAKVKNAGSVFLGMYSPEALGDYFAGPNHTLPTNGTARFSSPLSVDDFIKKTSFIYYTEDALNKVGDKVAAFAESEGLTAHAESVRVRLKEKK